MLESPVCPDVQVRNFPTSVFLIIKLSNSIFEGFTLQAAELQVIVLWFHPPTPFFRSIYSNLTKTKVKLGHYWTLIKQNHAARS